MSEKLVLVFHHKEDLYEQWYFNRACNPKLESLTN